MIKKFLYGGPGYFIDGPKDFDKSSKKVASGFNWVMGKVGNVFNSIIAGLAVPTGTSTGANQYTLTSQYKKNLKVLHKAKEKIEDKMVYLSPTSHVAAWLLGSLDPHVGAQFFARDPRLQALGIIGDMAIFKYGPKAVKPSKTRAVGKEFKKMVDEGPRPLELIMPGLIGWAPKLKFKGYHASNERVFIPNFWYEGWALKTHNAPFGIYLANGKTPGYGFLTKRPWIHQLEVSYDKPMVQLGEVKGKTKNGIRNLIERLALSMGADGIIYKGIADNQMTNQFITKTLNPNVRVKYVNPILKSNKTLKIRSRLVTDGEDVWEQDIHDYYKERVRKVPDDIKYDIKEDIGEGLQRLFWDNGFHVKHKVNLGKFNELFGVETIRRLLLFGISPAKYISIWDGPSRIILTVLGRISQNAKTPSYMGYFDEVGTPGFYSPFWDTSVIDPTLNLSIPDLTFHERNMHGSEGVLEAATSTPNSGKINIKILLNYGMNANPIKPYLLFINNLIYKKGTSELLPSIKPIGNTFKYKWHLFADGALNWEEARATIGQVIRKLYMKAKNGKSYNSIEEIRPEFEKLVDNIPDNELGDLLYKTNDYGKTYYYVGPNVNPNFYKELRALLKYAPVTLPFIFGNNEKE